MKEMVRTGCRRLRLSVGVCLVCAALQGGTAHAQDYGKPLDMPVLQSSSNFGKLRSTRFHSGVDFRTGGVEGKRVLAVEDGQIYRIGVKPYGYGNVVYVAHPDGNISVYGHLSKFTPEVEAYVRSERYRQQRNDIDLFPEAGRFPVKRGEVIGLSGNSGNSFGPHLHFETRYCGQSFDPERLIDFQSGNLRRETFLLKKSYLDIHSSASQDFEDEEAEANDEKRAEEARKALASAQYHRIRSGDTLGGIAVRYGTTVSRLCQLNGISRTTTLRIGRSLRVR